MPLRFLHYLSDVYRNMYGNDMLHRRSMIKLPVPHFVTFYNGLEKWIETDEVIKLSDMFELPVDKLDIRTAVINAIDECIEEGILVDFFEEHREEVVEVSIYDYDEEKTRKTLFEEAKEMCRDEVKAEVRKELEGEVKNEAIAEGKILNLINIVIKKVKKDKLLTTIASELEENVEDIRAIYDAVVEAAPDYDEDVIIKKLNNKSYDK